MDTTRDFDPVPDWCVTIDYTNWKGDRSQRKVIPNKIYFSSNEWHKEPQWLLQAFDIDKREWRTFAMKDIHSWTMPSTPTSPSLPKPTSSST